MSFKNYAKNSIVGILQEQSHQYINVLKILNFKVEVFNNYVVCKFELCQSPEKF